MNEDLDKIEEKLKNQKNEKEKTPHKVSGRSVFKLKEIMQSKNKEKVATDEKDYLEHQD